MTLFPLCGRNKITNRATRDLVKEFDCLSFIHYSTAASQASHQAHRTSPRLASSHHVLAFGLRTSISHRLVPRSLGLASRSASCSLRLRTLRKNLSVFGGAGDRTRDLWFTRNTSYQLNQLATCYIPFDFNLKPLPVAPNFDFKFLFQPKILIFNF